MCGFLLCVCVSSLEAEVTTECVRRGRGTGFFKFFLRLKAQDTNTSEATLLP